MGRKSHRGSRFGSRRGPWKSWTGRRFSEPAACAKGISRWLSCRPTRPHPFVSVPPLAGAVRIEAPGSRAAAALTNEHGDEFFFTPVRSDEHEYTGLSILNEGPEEMEVLIEAYAADGELLDAAELIVAGSATRIGLLQEFLPDLGSADGGYVRVTVDVDPDAGPRLAGADGRHPAAASGRTDGALGACRE